MKAFVTGATGLIGTHLVRELRRHGWEVCAMIRNASRAAALAATGAECVQADILQTPKVLAPLMKGCDVVFHTAAHFAYAGLTREQLEKTALDGTRHVLEAAAATGVSRAVVTSSSVVFGSSVAPVELDEAAPLGGTSPDGFVEPDYMTSKVSQDRLAAELGRSLGLEVLFACPTMTVGPQPAALGPSNGAILAYLADPLRMTYPGGCNFVSARDVATGHRLIACNGAPNEHYLLGSENLVWREIHTLVADLCGVEPPRMLINHTLAYLAATVEEWRAPLRDRKPLTTRTQARMVGRYYWYSHAKAAKLGFDPTPSRFALAETCAWLAASPHVSRELRATLLLHPDVHATRKHLKLGSTHEEVQ